MKRLILMLILAVSNLAVAEPYKEYSLEQLENLFTLHEEGETNTIDIDTPTLIEMTESLEKHAVSYPARFDKDSDRKLAQRDVVYLTGVLDILSSNIEKDIVLLDLTLRLNNVSYNLDVQPDLAYDRLTKAANAIFKLEPDNIGTHYRLGYFLAANNHTPEAIPHLQKAAENDVVNANYALAMIYLSEEKFDKALEYLTIYKEKNPENEQVDKLIEAIKSGKIEIEKKANE